MSGGVDSAVAAARAAEAGHDVTGVHLALSANPSSYRTGARGCCTLEDARDARRAADVIGIPFYVWDLAERFAADVVRRLRRRVRPGQHPNPCLRCNEKIKFAAVLDRAVALGFDAVCTGHHARHRPQRPAGPRLVRSVDQAKDQSYVLAVLTGEQLSRAMFPLGDSTKDQVRAEAARRGSRSPTSRTATTSASSPTATPGRSCAASSAAAPGPIVDADGQVIGRHEGSYGFTVGQRRGLRIDTPAPDGRPRYVLDIEPVSGTVRVGPAAALDVDEITAVRPVWTGCAAARRPDRGRRSSCARTARRSPRPGPSAGPTARLARIRLARPGPGRRPRPGGRPLRRRHGRPRARPRSPRPAAPLPRASTSPLLALKAGAAPLPHLRSPCSDQRCNDAAADRCQCRPLR